MFDNDNVNDIHDNVDYKYDDNRLFQFSVMIAMIIAGLYIIESFLIFPTPPAFDFLSCDASRRVFVSMIFFLR